MIWPWKIGNNASKRAKEQQQISEKRKTLTAVVASAPQLGPLDLTTSRADKRQSAPRLTGLPSGIPIAPAPAKRRESNEEATALREQVRQLEADFIKLDEERQKHINKLQAELQNHNQETEAKQRVIELRTKERDEAHRARDEARHARDDAHRSLDVFQGQVKKLQEQFGMIEERRKQVDEDAETKRKELEEIIAVKDKEMESLRSELGQVRENAQALDAGNAALKEAAEAVKIEAEKQMEGLRLELKIAADKAEMIEVSNRSLNEDLEIAQAQSRAFGRLGEDLEAVKADLKQATDRADTHEATNKGLLTAKASLAAELEGAKNELTLKIDALETKNKELESELLRAKAHAATTAKEVNAAEPSEHSEDEVLALSEELETTKAELLKARSQISDLQSRAAVTTNGVHGVSHLDAPPSPASPTTTTHPLRTKSSYRNEFSEPVRFTPFTAADDFRIGIDRSNGDVKVDVREWSGGARTRRGVAMEVKDAQEVMRLLPHVVAAAEMVAGEMKAK